MSEENKKEEESKISEELKNEESEEEDFSPLEEEIGPPPQEEVEEDIVEERFYTIPLGKARRVPANKRAAKSVGMIKDFVKRHMKLRDEAGISESGSKRLIISNEVNERVWRRGIGKPPRKVRVRAARDVEGNITVYLAEGD